MASTFLTRDYLVKAHEVALELGSPFYLYDMEGLKTHAQALVQEAQSAGVKLYYACKANPLSCILRTLYQAGLGVDVASLGELGQALNIGVTPDQILTTGPAKSKDYFLYCVRQGLRSFVVESENQLHWLNDVCRELNVQAKVLLRVQLEWREDEQSVLGGNRVTAFGMDLEQLQILSFRSFTQLDIIGAHVFQWGNIRSEQRLVSLWQQICQTLTSSFEQWGLPLKVLDLGGGLGISYQRQDLSNDGLSFGLLMNELTKLQMQFGIGQFWLELGRFAVGPYGHYFTRVIDRKKTRGKEILVLEGGINHQARKALTGESFPAFKLDPKGEVTGPQLFELHGPLCTSLDHLGSFTLPENTGPGDWILFAQAGAYGFTESMPYFLCHDLPGEVALYKQTYEIMRSPMGAHTWLR